MTCVSKLCIFFRNLFDDERVKKPRILANLERAGRRTRRKFLVAVAGVQMAVRARAHASIAAGVP